MKVNSSARVIGLTAVVLTLMMLLLATPLAMAQATEMGESGNLTIVRAKAIALQYMLNNSLRLNFNLSEQLRLQIEQLLNVNISELMPQELWDFVRNANIILAEVWERARNAVGISLEAYVHGLAVAIETKVRNVARHYDVSEDEVRKAIVNVTQSGDMREMFETLKELQRTFVERQSQKFADALADHLKNRTVKAIEGAVSELGIAYDALNYAQDALATTLERLKVINASSIAINAVERALEHVKIVKEVISHIREVLPKPLPVLPKG